jgi:hypothetical protein
MGDARRRLNGFGMNAIYILLCIKINHGVKINVDQDEDRRLNSKMVNTQAQIMCHMGSCGMVRICQMRFVY